MEDSNLEQIKTKINMMLSECGFSGKGGELFLNERLFETISSLLEHLESNDSQVKEIVEMLCNETKIVEFLADSLLYLVDNEVEISPMFEKLETLIYLVYNFSYYDSSIASKKLSDCGVILGLLNFINVYITKFIDKSLTLARIALMTIFPLAKMPTLKSYFLEIKALDKLTPFLSHENPALQIRAFCISACLLGDLENPEKLLYDHQIIPNFVRTLHDALESEESGGIAGINGELFQNKRMFTSVSQFFEGAFPRSTHRKVIAEMICNDKELLEFLVDSLHYVVNNEVDLSTVTYKLNSLLRIITHLSNCDSNVVPKALADCGVIPAIFYFLCVDMSSLKGEGKRLELLSMCIIHNLSKSPELNSRFREINAIDKLTPFLTHENSKQQISAFSALAFLLNDSANSEKLLDEYQIIPKLVKTLHKALENEQHESAGFSAEELVASLAILAVNDVNKTKIVENGAIDALETMLAPSKDVLLPPGGSILEQKRSVDCLWTLAFDKSIREKISGNDEIIKKLGEIAAKSDDVALKMKSQRVIDFIMGFEARPHKATSEDLHIFISYSWQQQKVILKINELLVGLGHKVWLDVDKMRGSTLEAMASAVEGAKLVLICYSENYRLSNMCRCEAEYVFKLGKPFIPVNMEYRYQPTGWLGIIIGAKLYVDFSLFKHPIEAVSRKLINEIEAQTSDLPIKELEPEVLVESVGPGNPNCQRCLVLESLLAEKFGSNRNVAFTRQSTNIQNSVRQWNHLETLKWFESAGLGHPTCELDGQALLGLYDMKMKGLDVFYQYSSEIIGRSNFLGQIKFSAALDKLISDSQ